MSPRGDNVAIVRRFYERWNAEDVDGVLECAHPEMEFDWSASRAPWSGVYRGHEGLMQVWEEQLDAWERFSVEIAEAIELDTERLVTATVVRGRGRGSGITMEARGGWLWTVRAGRIASARFFQTKEEALEAAGASAQEAPD
jgi:ketosteroid isomerase-like protein